MISYSAVVCTDLANGIGKRGERLLWHVPEELRHFKSITLNHPVVMGRKTYESIGKPLPNRQNIVLTRTTDYQADGCTVIHNADELESLKLIDNEVMVIGGLEIYKLFWDKFSVIHQSIIKLTEKQCDLFFPQIKPSEWDLELTQIFPNFNLLTFIRKKRELSSI